jgi:kynureninase
VIAEVGIDRIRARQQELQGRVISRADDLGLEVRTPRDPAARGGVVNVKVGDAERICYALLDRDVCTDFRGDGLRISPHFFTNEADVDRCFDALRGVI